jgi:hypothetical protein
MVRIWQLSAMNDGTKAGFPGSIFKQIVKWLVLKTMQSILQFDAA